MNRILLSILLCLISWIVPAQEDTNARLQSLLTQPNTPSKVDDLIAVGNLLLNSDWDKVIEVAEIADSLAMQIDYQEGSAYANKLLGTPFYYRGDAFRALQYWDIATDHFISIKDNTGVSNIQNNIGSLYRNQGELVTALEFYTRSLENAEKIIEEETRNLRVVSALYGIGNVHTDKADYQLAKEYFFRALGIAIEMNDNLLIATITQAIGELYYNSKKFDSALVFLQRSMEFDDDPGFVSYGLNFIGKSHAGLGNYEEAINYHTRAIEAARPEYSLEERQGLIGLGNTHFNFEEYNNALLSFLEAEELSSKERLDKELRDTYEGLYKSYERLSDYSNAFKYQTLFLAVKDSIFNEAISSSLDRQQYALDLSDKEKEKLQIEANARTNRIIMGTTIGVIALGLVGLYSRFRYVRKTNKIIADEKERSENLLLNILPAETAEELKENGEAKARKFDQVSILFTDFKGFTAVAANLAPEELVKEIHERYKMFDLIMTRYGVEKIKTIGDAYMAAGGLPVANNTHAFDVVRAAIDIREYMDKVKKERETAGKPFFEVRIGVHTGPVVAGIVGTKKFAYDIWGDTVNIASRMESNSEPGKINISESTYEIIKDQYQCEYRGEIEAKNRGMLKMYFVNSPVGSAYPFPEQVEV